LNFINVAQTRPPTAKFWIQNLSEIIIVKFLRPDYVVVQASQLDLRLIA